MNKKQKIIYRIILCVALIANIFFISVWYVKELENKIPSHIYLFENQKIPLSFHMPLWGDCEVAETTVNLSRKTGSYQGKLKLFGIIPYKKIKLDVINKEKVMPSGKAVGLYIQSDGIMVLGTVKVKGKDGLSYEPAKNILKPGDTIYKVQNESVKTIDDVVAVIEGTNKKYVTLGIRRNGNKIKVKIPRIVTKDGVYKLGVWLREDTEGIGTLSFVTRKNEFAALGHGIADIDTGKIIPLEKGEVYPAEIEDIKKGQAGEPGEFIGSVSLGKNQCIGKINSNTDCGITGNIDNLTYSYREKLAVPIGLKQEVKEGKAYIICQLGGSRKKYEIQIREINLNSRDNKGMVIEITDRELLNMTGGIVQGMSGAPIIQNGNIIGAVTHVFVNDPTKGYGIFIEEMLE